MQKIKKIKNFKEAGAINRRRLSQILSLALFWAALLAASDLFLRLDPLAALVIPLAARSFIEAFWPGWAVLFSALFLGRFFCGYICPLGSTLDLFGFLSRPINSPPPEAGSGKIKYLVLALVLGAALGGLNLAFWVSPLSLAARFHALLIHPLILLIGESGQELSRLAGLDWPGWLSPSPRRYSTLGFVLVFFVALFVMERRRPRFWCRYLCPAGALLGLCARRPRLRRRTTDCRECGLCLSACPAGAIRRPDYQASAAECLTCRACAPLCPAGAIHFLPRPGESAAGAPERPAGAGLSRRLFLNAGAGGLALAGVELAGQPGLLAEPLRPPGSRPEIEFLARCLRCGLCLKACPTNGLQAAWLESGSAGLFSPILVPRRGPCEPDCRACGLACPSEAILKLPQPEKKWAKIGVAEVRPASCLAWAAGRSCVVCQEVCPFGAVRPVPVPGTPVHGPKVEAARCFGCGYCEHFCPLTVPAIVVSPNGALRLNRAEFRATGEAAGLNLSTETATEEIFEDDRLPPGFIE